jgi:hypothetical protein
MDWYLVGRILGVLFWPLAAAVALYGIGWFVSLSRPPQTAVEIKRWGRFAAIVGFLGTLFFTGRDFLKYTGAIG